MNINLEYYKIFYYTARAGSITRAAELLSVSQPAVSQAVRTLEEEVGMPLFVRTGKGVRLTPAGEVLYSYVERGYESILMGEMKLRELQNLESGEIRIGASDMTLRFFLLPYLQRFHEAYPGIKLTVTNGPTPETLKMMQEGRIDFGVVTDPVGAHGDLQILKMREISDVFVAGYRFLELKHRTIPLKELERLPIICLEKNTSTRRYMDAFLKENKVFIQPEIELATSDMIVEFARRNFGVANVVYDFAREYLEKGELFELKLSAKIPKRSICVILEREKGLSAAAQRLLSFLNEKGD
ncbi:MAG TPA: LysR family transcriptional regulator [Candidatus Limivivens merdigallinarum]|uniref:LysR family transcriptional regulator n=1 Tax=Candidatus Limivivens merdigallinarum TaxID=2840859 RepID=A0A9D0ZXA7_9FIRM|nr:LysR family transcriptional regulator [Candidatus Limivivens merdigallinarum]